MTPGNAHELHLLERAAAGDPVAFAAPTVMEVGYGLAKTAARDDAFRAAHAWFVRLTSGGLVAVQELDGDAALVAGRLRAEHPLPPTTTRKRKGPKADQRTGWVLDMQIAACTWVAGGWLRTGNRGDFDAIADLLEQLYPDGPRLRVEPAPTDL